MKKWSILLVFLFSFVLTSCVNTRGVIPYGKWENAEYCLILDIDPKKSDLNYGNFPGTYQLDEDIIDVYIRFSNHSKEFDIYNISDQPGEGVANFHTLAYFGGSYRFNNDELVYSLQPLWKERMGIETIIFKKIADYEAPASPTLTP